MKFQITEKKRYFRRPWSGRLQRSLNNVQRPANLGGQNPEIEKVFMWWQTEIRLNPKPRGFHLVTEEIVREILVLGEIKIGLVHLLLKHTSASLTLNENADPSVRHDFEQHFNKMVPENAPYYRHNDEGSDDMPAHIKTSLLGPSLTLPITGGRLNLGTWQGIYLCEHRNYGGPRQLLVTLHGE